MEPREQRVILILADISGYTRFMVENQLSAVHGQMVITHLIESLLREVDLPLVLQEIEGDAVFLYAARPDDEAVWQQVLKQVQTKLVRFFESFVEATVTMGELTACECAVCEHADELSLKVVAHSGRAVFHRIGTREQVSGTDVILAHRLLKNSVPAREYLLLSDGAYREFGEGMGLDFRDGEEHYDEFGAVKTWVHLLAPALERARDEFYAAPPDPDKDAIVIRSYMQRIRGWIVPAMFRELRRPTSDAGLLARVGFTLGWLLYLPFYSLVYPRRVASQLADRRAQRQPPGR